MNSSGENLKLQNTGKEKDHSFRGSMGKVKQCLLRKGETDSEPNGLRGKNDVLQRLVKCQSKSSPKRILLIVVNSYYKLIKPFPWECDKKTEETLL